MNQHQSLLRAFPSRHGMESKIWRKLRVERKLRTVGTQTFFVRQTGMLPVSFAAGDGRYCFQQVANSGHTGRKPMIHSVSAPGSFRESWLWILDTVIVWDIVWGYAYELTD